MCVLWPLPPALDTEEQEVVPGQCLASLGRGGPNRNLHLSALGPSWGLQLLFVLAAPVMTKPDMLPTF